MDFPSGSVLSFFLSNSLAALQSSSNALLFPQVVPLVGQPDQLTSPSPMSWRTADCLAHPFSLAASLASIPCVKFRQLEQ
jgi:hypothetical protein